MILIKAIVSLIFLVVGLVLSLLCIFDEFTWLFLVGAIVAFVFSYNLWPSKKRGKRNFDNPFYDVAELLVDLPCELFFFVLRLFGRIFKFDFDF